MFWPEKPEIGGFAVSILTAAHLQASLMELPAVLQGSGA